MELSHADRQLLERLETELWHESTRFDTAHMNDLLAPDFIEIGRSGRVYQRDEILAVAPQPIGALLPLPEFCVRLLSTDIALVTYNSIVTSNGTVMYAHRSSIWSRTARGWMLRFHQGTPFQP